MSAIPDRDTLTLLRRRDPRGFDQAYAAYGARLYSFLCRLVGRSERHLADDLLQQTFLRLAEHGPELRADSDLRAWLYTVARNAFLGHVRGQRHGGEHPHLELIADYSTDVEARLLLGDVEQALGQLRVDDRELLLLVGVEGLEPQAVARILGIDPVTLRKRLARARQRLLHELEHQSPVADKKATHDRA
jgi:RNA polymerase sigma-70 factor (ECF subfamily)